MSLWSGFCKKCSDISIGSGMAAVVVGVVACAAIFLGPASIAATVVIGAKGLGGFFVTAFLATGVIHYVTKDEHGYQIVSSGSEDLKLLNNNNDAQQERKKGNEEAKCSCATHEMLNSLKKDFDALKSSSENRILTLEEGILLDKVKSKKEMSEVKSRLLGAEVEVATLSSSFKNSQVFFNASSNTSSPNAVNDPALNEQPSRSNLRNRRSASNN